MKDHDKGFGKCAFGTAAFGTPGSYTYFRYNKAGWLEKQKNFNRTFAYYTWDKAGRESAIHHEKSDATALVTLDYTRDKNGNITKIDRESGRYMEYTYDRTEQLLSEIIKAPDGAPLYSFEYEYDGAGNRLRMIRDGGNTYYTYNKANELRTEFRGTEHAYFFYDGKGNTVRERQKDGFNRYYRYDADNMMMKVHYAGEGARTDQYFSYNGLAERVQEKCCGLDGQDVRSCVFDRAQCILVKDDLSAAQRYVFRLVRILASSWPLKFVDLETSADYAYHLASPSVLCCSTQLQDKGLQVLFNLFATELQREGHLTQRFGYDARPLDTNILCYQYHFRTYSAAICRWIQREPWRNGNTNRYSFLSNNPNHVEFAGLLDINPGSNIGGYQTLAAKIESQIAEIEMQGIQGGEATYKKAKELIKMMNEYKERARNTAYLNVLSGIKCLIRGSGAGKDCGNYAQGTIKPTTAKEGEGPAGQTPQGGGTPGVYSTQIDRIWNNAGAPGVLADIEEVAAVLCHEGLHSSNCDIGLEPKAEPPVDGDTDLRQVQANQALQPAFARLALQKIDDCEKGKCKVGDKTIEVDNALDLLLCNCGLPFAPKGQRGKEPWRQRHAPR